MGWLAQVAFVGFAFAALVTRQGPIEALQSHLSDPFGNNIITNIGRWGTTPPSTQIPWEPC